MTSPDSNFYQVCGSCTAKWFAATPCESCPRCGASTGPAVAAKPPWAGSKLRGGRNIESSDDSLSMATEFLQTVPAVQRFSVVLEALRATLPFESSHTPKLHGFFRGCWSEVNRITWPDTLSIVLQTPLRHSTRRHVERLVSQPDRRYLRELLVHLVKRCHNGRLITVARVYREVQRILRHTASKHRLYVDPDGWACADGLVKVINQRSLELQLWRDWRYSDLQRQASMHADQRVCLNAAMVRACYGHSIPDICVGNRQDPPPRLFHGTSAKLLPTILDDGLLPAERTLLHLTSDPHYAGKIAAKHQSPIVLVVAAQRAAQHDTIFWQCNSHVWQCSRLAPEFIVADDADLVTTGRASPAQKLIVEGLHSEKGCPS